MSLILDRSGRTPMCVLPFTVGGGDKAKDLFSSFDGILARLSAARF